METDIQIRTYTGEEVKKHIPEIAKMRIEVFVEYPFLYDGDYEYEKKYLNKFSCMKDAIAVVVFDGDELIGVSTGYPFKYELEVLQDVLRSANLDPKEYFCFGESVLNKKYRGQGIGSQFIKLREAHAKTLGPYKHICFYTSMRPKDDPRRPKEYRSLAAFWKKRGFVEHPELVGTVSYKEIGEEDESPKKMVFWIKDLS